MSAVTMVRVYLTEKEHLLEPLLQLLHDDFPVRGVTVFRGITGFGRSGQLHEARLVDLSLDQPLAVEFFDAPARVTEALTHLERLVEPGHIVHWAAEIYAKDQ